MKICEQGLYAQVIDGIGTVRVCGWAGYYLIGNLRDNTMNEVWNSEAAKKFRQTLLDGTYDFCNEENCPYMANGTLEKHMIEIDEIPCVPSDLSLAYDRRCNYHCTCCCSRNDVEMDTVVQKKIEHELLKCLPDVQLLSANGLGEFFVSDSIMRVVNQWEPKEKEKAVFSLETNGSLFNEKNWEKVKRLGRYRMNVALTVHSFDEAAYQYLSGSKLPVSNIEKNLRFVSQLHKSGQIDHLELATVMQERNFRTMPEFVRRCIHEFGADTVRVRRFLPEKAMDENIEWFFDVRNPLHPYNQEYVEMMKDPIFKDPHVWKWTGDNDLSNRGELPAAANYRVMAKLALTENVGEKISAWLIGHGYPEIMLYARTEIGKMLLKVLRGQAVKIQGLYDHNPRLQEWEGYTVSYPSVKALQREKHPILVTLVPRHGEITESLRLHGYQGVIISLDEILK